MKKLFVSGIGQSMDSVTQELLSTTYACVVEWPDTVKEATDINKLSETICLHGKFLTFTVVNFRRME